MLDDRTLLDHRRMLDDPRRVDPFLQALRSTCADRTVAEIGVGFGPLSLFALQSGARRVYGIEVDARTLDFSTELIRAHGYDEDRFVPLVGRSDEIDLPERVDVLVGELIDSVGIGENGAYFLADARRRWLRPGGRVMPGRIRVEVALSASERFARERRFFGETLRTRHGLDYRPVLDRLAAPRRSLTVHGGELLTASETWQEIDFGSGETARPCTALDFTVLRQGRIDGLVFGFVLDVVDGIDIDTRPGTPPTSWEQGFLPLPVPIEAHEGDHFHAVLTCPTTVEPWAPLCIELEQYDSVTSVDVCN